jgi:hypothetical protein
MLVCAGCGAAIGFALYYVVARPTNDEPGLALAFASIVAILGAVAAECLSPTGWAMLGGGIHGAIVTGLLGVVATLHLKGLMYSFIGVPIGAVFVLLYGRPNLEAEKPLDKAGAPPVRSGL